jgi:endonuclease/exonuclease/phosphatase family metal-dependent hydrolase
VLAVTCVVAAVAWLSGATHDSSSATPVPVVTAPVSTAPTPAPGAAASVISPPLRVVTQPDACSGADAPVLRVLQFNIRAARTGSGGVDLPRIAAEISAVRPDLVSLNEVDTDTTRTHADEPAYLARATGLHVVYGPNVIYDGGPFGNAVLTRYPVVESHNLRLPGAPGLERRGLLTVVVDVDGHHVAFSSTHLSDGDTGRRSRLLQALAVARALRSTPGPTILAGDLNSDPGDVPARILRQGLLDAQRESGTGPGGTYPQDDPVGRFDYILYDRDLATVPGSTRVRTSESSDHRAVLTRLVLPTRRGC